LKSTHPDEEWEDEDEDGDAGEEYDDEWLDRNYPDDDNDASDSDEEEEDDDEGYW
jgi:hypothetical protein